MIIIIPSAATGVGAQQFCRVNRRIDQSIRSKMVEAYLENLKVAKVQDLIWLNTTSLNEVKNCCLKGTENGIELVQVVFYFVVIFASYIVLLMLICN